jgi:hypothetical protein
MPGRRMPGQGLSLGPKNKKSHENSAPAARQPSWLSIQGYEGMAIRGSFPDFPRPYGMNMLLSTYYSDRLSVPPIREFSLLMPLDRHQPTFKLLRLRLCLNHVVKK